MPIAAVASAIGLAGSAFAGGVDRTSTSADTSATMSSGAKVSSPDTSAALNSAAQLDGSTPATPGAETSATVNSAAQLDGSTPATPGAETSATVNWAAQLDGSTPQGGTTQGSTMSSPQSYNGSGSAATASGSTAGTDRLGSTNSENFDRSMSDYAAHHGGRLPAQGSADAKPGEGTANSKGE